MVNNVNKIPMNIDLYSLDFILILPWLRILTEFYLKKSLKFFFTINILFI